MTRKLFILSDNRGDVWTADAYDIYEEAFREARYQWNHLTRIERQERIEFAIYEATVPEGAFYPFEYDWTAVKYDFKKSLGKEEA